jgi:hypothetical protein
MKKLVVIIAAILFGLNAFAQNEQPAQKKQENPKAKEAAKADLKYYCPKCFYCDSKSGKCLTHNSALVMLGQFYCPYCYVACCEANKTTNQNTCTKCGKDLKKMEAPKK